MSDDDQTPVFSRSGKSSPMGKCSAELRVAIPDQLRDDLQGLAFVHGLPMAEYVRELLMAHVYGHIDMVRARQRAPVGRGE